MKQYKIYGETYVLEKETDTPVDMFAVKGELVDDPPIKGKVLGYVKLEDGASVACYKGKSKLPLLLALLLVLFIGAGVAVYFTQFYHPEVAIGGTMLETTVNKNLVTFNGIMSAQNGMCDVRFVNGEYPATVTIIGDGVESEPLFLEAYASAVDMPLTVTTDKSVIEVTIRIESEGDVADFNALVEVPDNNNGNDQYSGLNHYFEKEVVVSEN